MNPNGEWDQLSDIPPEETEFADVWHPAENPYPYRETQFYRLRSVIGDEPGPPGNIAEGWRELVPVQALNATDASFDDFIQITWEGVPGADGYELEYRRIGEPLPPFEMLQRIEGGAITWFEHSSTFPPGRCAEQRQYYEYRLHATIGSDCCATWSEPDQGCLNAEPTPSLSASNDQGPRPLTVQFDGSSSYDWDGGELTFEWDWESDGTWDLTETIGVVSHTYVEEGVYQATMQVTDDEGSQDWFSHFGYVSGWQHTWSSTGEMLSGIAVDDQYNIYAIGTTLNSPGSDIDGLILKYSSAGNLLWARRWSGASDDYLIDGCIDGDGNLHAIGCTQSVGEGIDDVLLLKLAPDGTLLWQKTWGSSNQEKGQAICRKGTEIAVCGYIWEAGGTDLKGLILTYDASTGALNWHKEVSCSQSLSFDDIELGFGQYVLTGYYDVGPEYNANTYVGAVNVETAALISETAFDGGSFDSGNDVAVDMDTGYIYVSGMTDSYTTNRYQQIVLKLDSTLTLVWSKHIGDADEYDQPMGIWAGDGHVYTSGTQSHGLLNSIALCDLDEAGNLSSFWLIGTESECSQGLNLTIDSEGRLAMVGIANSAYMQVQPAPCSSLNAAGNLLSPGSTIADCNGTLTGQSVTWLTPSGIEDENNNDQNAGYIARLDLSVL
ncbi:MAG TPA: PKD domain-containing protein [Firmicutes bacterium]|nr:PKD domain-containing protein [Bacillota bacterium]